MTTRRFLLLLGASMVAIIGAMYLSSLRHLDRDPRGGSLLPGFEAQLDQITDIRIRKGGKNPSASLHRVAPGNWIVQERAGYPADVSKIRKLLLALADAKIAEEKTSNPANYKVIGVEEPTDADATGVEISLTGPAVGRALIVGKPAAGGTYVRRGGEAGSFAVEPPITVESIAREWIDPALLSVPAEKIQSIQVRFADGTGYTIARKMGASPATPGPYALETVPRGRESADAATIAPSPTSFGGITVDDVAAAADVDFSKPSVCDVKLFDGATYQLTGAAAAEKHWIKVSGTKDEALNARARGRAFEIAGYRYDAVFRPLEQLLKPKPDKHAPKALKQPAAPH